MSRRDGEEWPWRVLVFRQRKTKSVTLVQGYGVDGLPTRLLKMGLPEFEERGFEAAMALLLEADPAPSTSPDAPRWQAHTDSQELDQLIGAMERRRERFSRGRVPGLLVFPDLERPSERLADIDRRLTRLRARVGKLQALDPVPAPAPALDRKALAEHRRLMRSFSQELVELRLHGREIAVIARLRQRVTGASIAGSHRTMRRTGGPKEFGALLEWGFRHCGEWSP